MEWTATHSPRHVISKPPQTSLFKPRACAMPPPCLPRDGFGELLRVARDTVRMRGLYPRRMSGEMKMSMSCLLHRMYMNGSEARSQSRKSRATVSMTRTADRDYTMPSSFSCRSVSASMSSHARSTSWLSSPSRGGGLRNVCEFPSTWMPSPTCGICASPRGTA